MDELDCKILKCLKENSRMRTSAIAERIHLSVTATAERIAKLERAKIIRQYTAIIDSAKIGKDLSEFVMVSLEHPKYYDDFAEAVRGYKEILECHYITGDYDFLLKVICGGDVSLEAVLNFIKSIKGVSLTRSMVVLSTVKNELTMLPEIK